MPNPYSNKKLLILNLPNPPFRNVDREYAGGFGTATYLGHGKKQRPALNLFLPYSASVAEETGYNYSVLDAQALALSASEVLHEVERISPNLILSMIGLPSIYEDLKLLTQIKEKLPNTLVIGCGTVCKVMPNEVLSKSKIDLVFRDEFPYVSSLADLLTKLQKVPKKTLFKHLSGASYLEGTKLVNTTLGPHKKEFTDYIPLYDALPLDKYQDFLDLEGKKHRFVPILGSKGCPYNCIYCPYPVGFGRKYAFKLANAVANEIEYLHNSHGVRGFLFRNQSFTLNQKWAEKLCREILRRKLEIAWFCEARVDEVSRELLALMKKSGCKRIHYGVETGDPELIKIGKLGVDLKTIRKAFNVTKKLGIWTHAHMIIGLPGETQETLKKTSRFILDLDPDSISLNFSTPYPGTELYRIAKKNNWIIAYDWNFYSSNEVVMRTNDLNPTMLYDAKQKMAKAFLKHKISKLLSRPFSGRTVRLLTKYYAGRLLAESLHL